MSSRLWILTVSGLIAIGAAAALAIGAVRMSRRHSAESARRGPKVAFTTTSPAGSGRATSSSVSGGTGSSPSVARSNLEHLLRRLQRRVPQVVRTELVDSARSRLEEFEPLLLEILGEREHPLLNEAIVLTGELKIGMAASVLSGLATSGSAATRAAAITARTKICPWLLDELSAFLRDKELEVVLAAFESLATNPQRADLDVLEFLGHADARVRTAAILAMAEDKSPAWVARLCEYARKAEGEAASAAAALLGPLAESEPAEKCLYELLERGDWSVRREVFLGLSRKPGKLRQPERVVAQLGDQARSVRERLMGFQALESTGTIPLEWIKALVPGLHPVLQLAAARCLLAAGDAGALPVLVGLLDTKTSDHVDEEDRDLAKSASHEILVTVANRDFGPEADAWRPWQREVKSVAPCKLKEPLPTNW